MNKRKNLVKSIIYITLGLILVELGFYFFLLPSQLVTGGVMGISVIINSLIPAIKTSYVIFGLNIIFLILSLILLGKQFFFRTIYLSLLSPLIVFLLDTVFKIPSDLIISHLSESKLLICATVGGIMVGLGIGFALRHNASTGGIDILQKIISKFTKISFSKAMYLTDGLVILGGLFFYINGGSFDALFPAILSMIISGIIIDRVSISGRRGYTYFIISDHYEEIKNAIYKDLDRGITYFKAIGGFSGDDKKIIVCNIFKNQKIKADELINKIDEKAFVFIMESKEILGYGFSHNQEAFLENYLKEQEIKNENNKDNQ